MSEQKHGGGAGRMPLPSPRSTQELDHKILAYARDNAPRQRRHRPARWVAGLATAGIVAVAVLIALPQTPAPQLTRQAEERSLQEMDQAAAPAASMKMSRAEPQKELSNLEEYASEPVAAAARALPAAPLADAGAEIESNVDYYLTSPDADSATSNALAVGESSAINEEKLHEQLELCAELLGTGREAQARATYQALRLQCPACELPERLEEAIEQELWADKP